MKSLPTEAEETLARLLGPRGFVTDAAEREQYARDRCHGPWRPNAVAVARPASTDEVAATVRTCAEHGVLIVPSGGRTGLAGGAAACAGELVISLDRLRRVPHVDPAQRLVRADAGCTVQQVQEAAAGAGLLYPVDFAAKGSAQIGGSIATNAGGIRVLRYGSTRRWVAGLEVVLASGEVVELGGALHKDNTGYDLTQLMIGSEGTLGLITAATLRLTDAPKGRQVVLCGVRDVEAVVDLYTRLRDAALPLQAFECFDAVSLREVLAHRGREGERPLEVDAPWYALIELETRGAAAEEREQEALLDVLEPNLAAGAVLDAVVAAHERQAESLWELREGIGEAVHHRTPHKSDVSLPLTEIAAFVADYRGWAERTLPAHEPAIFGHVGDGNLHLNLLRHPDTAPEAFAHQCEVAVDGLYALVGERGGSPSAEHGIGLLKRTHLHHRHAPGVLDAMRAVKRALDPQGILNPGKLLP